MAAIGIMGGTFNPIHIGHTEIAKAAYVQYHLDEIWFMPNHIPAYKSEDTIVSGEDRLKMIQLAIQDLPYCKASNFELKRDGNTYTIDTLKLLKKQNPEHTFYFIMGADSLFSFHKWRDYQEIPNYATILVAPRDEKSKADVMKEVNKLNECFSKTCFHMIDCKEIPCSSSRIRELLEDNTWRYDQHHVSETHIYLSEAVRAYICSNHLYEKE